MPHWLYHAQYRFGITVYSQHSLHPVFLSVQGRCCHQVQRSLVSQSLCVPAAIVGDQHDIRREGRGRAEPRGPGWYVLIWFPAFSTVFCGLIIMCDHDSMGVSGPTATRAVCFAISMAVSFEYVDWLCVLAIAVSDSMHCGVSLTLTTIVSFLLLLLCFSQVLSVCLVPNPQETA